MSLLIAPHSDDEALFASYLLMREKPNVIVVFDGTSHEEKFGVTIEQRREETRNAMKMLDIRVDFLGLSEDLDDKTIIIRSFLDNMQNHNGMFKSTNRIYVPAKQGGHLQHDIVCEAAQYVFGEGKLLYYSTYQKDNLEPVGELEIKPTRDEELLKNKMLECYSSQIKINPHHFSAVKGKPEYLNLSATSWNINA